MTFEIIPAHDLPLAEQAEIFTRAFSGYVGGAFAMDANALARFIFHQGADLCYSRFIKTTEGLAGFGYINRTGNLSRLAGMGVVPEARRTGAARRLMLTLLEEAKARGEEAMVLEVIEQNPPAHTLYRGHGFREVTRLCGWRRRVEGGSVGKPLPESRQTLEEISLTRASQLPNALEYPELPWQISRHAVAKLAIGRAFRTENAVVVIGDPETTPIRVHALFSTISDRMDWTAVRQAILALLNRYPDREFFTPAVFPEKFSEEVFEPLGFIREPLSQFLMRHDLQIQTA